jgi:hypothetical protein
MRPTGVVAVCFSSERMAAICAFRSKTGVDVERRCGSQRWTSQLGPVNRNVECRKHLTWLESLPPQTCEALAAALARLGRVLEARSDLGRDSQPIRISPSPNFRGNGLANTPWSTEWSTSSTACAKPGPGRMSAARSGEWQESPIRQCKVTRRGAGT